jgi:hypothetical protein
MFVHGSCIGIRHDERRASIARWAHSAKDVGIFVALVFGLARPAAFGRPLVNDAILLANPCLIPVLPGLSHMQ